MSNNWTLIDNERDNENNYDDRSTALSQAAELHSLGVDDLGMRDPKGRAVELEFTDGDVEIVTNHDEQTDAEAAEDGADEDDTQADAADAPAQDVDEDGEQAQEVATDGQGEVVDATPTNATPTTGDSRVPENRNVSDDPLVWMPDEFTDKIDGSTAINRKGYAVLAHHYDIDVRAEVQVGPNETDFEYAQCTAVATTRDGKEYRAHGSAHVDRGDDAHLLLEMADTRAQKRALAMATGVGTVAVEELQNEMGGA